MKIYDKNWYGNYVSSFIFRNIQYGAMAFITMRVFAPFRNKIKPYVQSRFMNFLVSCQSNAGEIRLCRKSIIERTYKTYEGPWDYSLDQRVLI